MLAVLGGPCGETCVVGSTRYLHTIVTDRARHISYLRAVTDKPRDDYRGGRVPLPRWHIGRRVGAVEAEGRFRRSVISLKSDNPSEWIGGESRSLELGNNILEGPERIGRSHPSRDKPFNVSMAQLIAGSCHPRFHTADNGQVIGGAVTTYPLHRDVRFRESGPFAGIEGKNATP